MTSYSHALLGTDSDEGATSGPPAQIQVASDGGDLKVVSDGGDLDREDATTAEYIDDDADLHRENTTTAEAQTSSCRGDGVSVPQISSPDREAELETDAPTISSPDREAELETDAPTMGSGSCWPPLPGTDSGWGATSGLPAWILLDPVSYIDDDGDLDCANATTAEAQTISWREDGVKVSFFAANPPCPSHFSIRVPSLREKPYLLCGRPSILYSVRNLALISVTFDGYRSETEYYLYRVVGRGRRPSLVHLKYISQQLREVIHVVSVGLLLREGDGLFVLAALALEQAKGEQYGVHVFRSERGTWTSKVHVLERHQIGNMRLYNVEKVIVLADGELGFVDLWNGILALDVLQENLIPRYIPLPKLLPGNHSDDQLGLSAKYFRDVIFSTDGLIKCVELEMCWKRMVHEKPRASDRQGICTESQKDVWESDMLYDADLMHRQIVDNENEEVKETFEYLGWRLISWSRKPDFACWRKDCSIHAKDIINTIESQLWGSSSHALQLNELSVSFPTLSMDGNELYVVSKVRSSDLESRVIVVDLGKNSLKEFSPFPTKRPDLFEQAYIACDLFKYMNMPSDETETGWDDAYLSVSSTLEPNEESGVTKSIRPSNHYPSTEYYICSAISSGTVSCFCMNQLQLSNGSQVYGHKALFLRLPLLEHENILSVRTLQSVEEPSEGAPVGLQLILLDEQALVEATNMQSADKPGKRIPAGSQSCTKRNGEV